MFTVQYFQRRHSREESSDILKSGVPYCTISATGSSIQIPPYMCFLSFILVTTSMQSTSRKCLFLDVSQICSLAVSTPPSLCIVTTIPLLSALSSELAYLTSSRALNLSAQPSSFNYAHLFRQSVCAQPWKLGTAPPLRFNPLPPHPITFPSFLPSKPNSPS